MEKIRSSFINRVILMMGGLLLFDLIIFGMVWKYSSSVIEKSMNEEISHLLNIYADTLEYSLNNTDMNLLTIAQEQSYLEELSNPDDAKRYYASMHLFDLVKRLRSNNDGVDMLLAAGNYEDTISDASERMRLEERDEIIAFLKERRNERKMSERMPTGTSGWVLQNVDTTLYLVRIYDTQDYSVSAWAKIDSMANTIAKLEENSDRHLFLTDPKGMCIKSVLAGEEQFFDKYQAQCIKWSRSIGKSGLQIVCFADRKNIFGQMPFIPISIFGIILGMMGLLLWFWRYVGKEIFVPIRELIRTISYIGQGDYQHRIVDKCKSNEFIALNKAFNSMMDTIVQLRIREYERQIQLQETELKYFQMQIRPHFFLNAMATIHSMSFENRCEDIRLFISALSQNIRYMFKTGLHTVPLEDEWEHLDHYFEMQEILYPGCVFYFIERDEKAAKWQIPQMILHTFMENKYKHSVRIEGLLSIYISSAEIEWKGKRVLQITIEDDGEPFPMEIVKKEKRNTVKADGSGVGLLNIEKTLEIMYGETELLTIENPDEGGTRIILLIPEHTVL